MATLPRSRTLVRPTPHIRVRSLLRLNEAVQKINSILELDVLLDRIVNDIAVAFGCLEATILLKEDGSDEMVVAAVMGCTQCSKRDRFRIGIDGLTGWVASTGLPVYTPDVTKEPRYIACEETTRSELDLPLIAHGEVIGVFSAQHPDVDGFPGEQRELLEALARHIAVAIWNARMFERERAERRRALEQEAEAHRIQRALFPKAPPVIEGFHVSGECISAGAVGGDWYDFLPHQDGTGRLWSLVLADVAGKGISAALLMSATRGILRSTAEHLVSPAAVLDRVNRVLCGDLPVERFVTMVYAVLDPLRRTLTYANAGHPWPLFANGHGAQSLKTASGLPLGIADCEYDEQTIELPPGSRLLFYSDGVSEACNRAEEEYGLDRLRQHVLRPDVTAAAVLDDVRAFSGGRVPADDATVIVLRG
ncbi:MAG: PP2C family protein-serine/threonine phosphatase [Terriglobales bacterium]